MRIKSILLLGTLIFAMLSINSEEAFARGNYQGEYITISRSMSIEKIETSKETCIQCHSKVTPRIVNEYNMGAHSKVGLGCVDCHGKNHRNMPIVTGKKVCIKCHAKETKEMLASKHSQSWSKMWDNGRYWSQPKAMQVEGCGRCHDISYGFSDARCDYCHSTHEFSVKEAKSPSACTTCHMGPDHPQAEAYQDSAHGILYKNGQVKSKGGQGTPTCITCHQAGGSHNVSKNIGIGGVSNGGALLDWDWMFDSDGKPKLKRTLISNEEFEKARSGNLKICNQCHNQQFNQQWLDGGDQVKILIDQKLIQAEGIIKELSKEGLLYPNPNTRPKNPVDGAKLVLGGNQLYTGTSKAEAIYFKMYKFAAAQGWKSAYHQNFQRAGYEGIKEMQLLMGELQEEAQILRLLGPINNNINSRDSIKNDNEQNKNNYWIFIVIGTLIGGLAAISIELVKRKKGNLLLLVVLLNILILTTNSNKALAWDGANKDQSQCVLCHLKQDKELKSGIHSGLKCLSCHEIGADLNQVRKPETCGKCHSGSQGSQLETYLSSPHGVQYQIKGINKWVPTCVTCHMPGGIHNPKRKLVNNEGEMKGYIGEVCQRCHITDDIIKFSDDMSVIYKMSNNMINSLNQVGLNLIEKGILVSRDDGSNLGVGELKKKWGSNYNWTMINEKNLSPQEQELVNKLILQLDQKTKEGIKVFGPKMRTGIAHINPDYTHWYGNAYLNLTLSEAKNTAIEIEMFANKAGFKDNKASSNTINSYGWGILLSVCTAILVFLAVRQGYKKFIK